MKRCAEEDATHILIGRLHWADHPRKYSHSIPASESVSPHYYIHAAVHLEKRPTREQAMRFLKRHFGLANDRGRTKIEGETLIFTSSIKRDAEEGDFQNVIFAWIIEVEKS